MPDVNDIHIFYEANLPEYKRKDLVEVNRFFLELMGITKKPIASVLKHFQSFKELVCFEWLGNDEIRERLAPKPQPVKEKEEFIITYGKYNGSNMEDLPMDYLLWLRKNDRATEPVKRFLKLKNK